MASSNIFPALDWLPLDLVSGRQIRHNCLRRTKRKYLDNSFDFLNFFFFMFIHFQKTERESTSRGGTERGRHRMGSRLQAPSCQPRAQRGARTHGPRDHDPSRSRTLSRLSHPGAPLLTSLCLSSFYYSLRSIQMLNNLSVQGRDP